MAQGRQGIPLPESRQRPSWRTGSSTSRGGKYIDAEILGDTQITTAGDVTLTGTTAITQEAWTVPTLLNSWVDFGGVYQTIRYRKDASGVVWLQGMIKDGTKAGGTQVMSLPAGYRPDKTLILSATNSTKTYCDLSIQSDGSVKAGYGWDDVWTFLSLSFPAA